MHLAWGAPFADDLLAQQSRRSGNSDASRNKAAVRVAHDLLKWRGYEVACTRGGKWALLAAILAGNQELDLFDHMRTLKQKPAPMLVKIRDEKARSSRLTQTVGIPTLWHKPLI